MSLFYVGDGDGGNDGSDCGDDYGDGAVVVMVMMMMMIELLLMMDNLTDIEAHTRFIDLKLQQSRRLCCIPDNVVADKNYFFVLLESVDALSKADDCVSGNVLSQTRINLSRV